jgi:hypothetical protein
MPGWVADLYWINTDSAMKLLWNFLEDEAALTLSGAEALLTLSGISATPPEPRQLEACTGAEDGGNNEVSWALCELCGRTRETVRWLPVWWRYSCGDEESKHRELTCEDPGDFSPPR